MILPVGDFIEVMRTVHGTRLAMKLWLASLLPSLYIFSQYDVKNTKSRNNPRR